MTNSTNVNRIANINGINTIDNIYSNMKIISNSKNTTMDTLNNTKRKSRRLNYWSLYYNDADYTKPQLDVQESNVKTLLVFQKALQNVKTKVLLKTKIKKNP